MIWTTPSLNYRYPSMLVHTSIDPMGIHFLCCIHGNKCTWKPMMQFATPLLPLCGMLASTWGKNNYMHFFQTCLIPPIDKLTLCSPKMAFAPKLTLSSPTQQKQIYFLNLVPPKDLLLSLWLKPKNKTIATNTPLINSSP
jgi:hypothetical protein